MHARRAVGSDDEVFEEAPVDSLARLSALLDRYPDLHVRYSEGPLADRGRASIDLESGLELPGLSVNPLRPEKWWSRPVLDWLARQLCQYQHLQQRNPDRYAWVLTGRFTARGPDCEPLLRSVCPVARITDAALTEAEARYRAHFDAGRGPEQH